MSDSQYGIPIPAETSDNVEPNNQEALNHDFDDREFSDLESALPEFGLLDVVEAFTAMRHEYRGQTRESRELAESMSGVADRISELEAHLTQLVSSAAEDDTARHLANSIVELDIHLTRAVQAAVTYDASQSAQVRQAIRAAFDKLGWVTRWFCRPFLNSALQAVAPEATSNTSLEGLSLVVSRLRHLMKEQGFERVETEGRPFDPETMNAIGAVCSEEHTSGYVVEQLSPAYFWRGRLLRFADVRVVQ